MTEIVSPSYFSREGRVHRGVHRAGNDGIALSALAPAVGFQEQSVEQVANELIEYGLLNRDAKSGNFAAVSGTPAPAVEPTDPAQRTYIAWPSGGGSARERAAANKPSVSPSAGALPSSTAGGPRYVGDAAVVGDLTVRRVLDAGAYLLTGGLLALFGGSESVWAVLLGLGLLGYGVKIAATRTSYWVNTAVYAVTIILVLGVGTVAFGGG
jgi:hypothetical protein